MDGTQRWLNDNFLIVLVERMKRALSNDENLQSTFEKATWIIIQVAGMKFISEKEKRSPAATSIPVDEGEW